MQHKTITLLSILVIALVNPAYADTIPNITPFLGGGVSAPSTNDYYFDNSGLNVSLASNGSGYTLTTTGSGNFNFYGPNQSFIDQGNAVSYSLLANFDASGVFIAAGSELTITGTLSSLPAGTTPFPANNILYDANLIGFGYNPAQADIGFQTQFLTSWSNQPLLTGGSSGESVYLFDQNGLSTGNGALSGLITAFQNGNPGSVAGNTYSPVESLTVVPLPFSAVLFATGLALLMGHGSLRRNIGKPISSSGTVTVS